MSKEYLSECISDLLKHYNERNFIEMAFAYDEVQICKGLKLAADKTFFTEILDGNKMIIPQSLLKAIEYDGEPILVSVQKKWNQVCFDTMYEGVTLKGCKQSYKIFRYVYTFVGTQKRHYKRD